MKYLTRTQMQEIDHRTIQEYGIPGMVLMENAGRSVAEESLRMLGRSRRPSVVVLCGPGNNGGDGLVVARHLFNHGAQVTVIFLGRIKNALARDDDAAINLKIALKMRIPVKETFNLKSIIAHLKSSSLIIDAIFGIGLARPVGRKLRKLIQAVNRLKRPVIAVDVPSGLDCDTGEPLGGAIQATETITFAAPKIGFKNPLAKKYLGKLTVVDIGIPRLLLKPF